MQLAVVLSVYAAVGALVTAYTLYHAVILRPRLPHFTLTDQVILSFAALGVGLLWVLFVPGLTFALARQISRAWQLRPGGLTIQRTEQVRLRT
ncbi:MAG: hypothetical protein GEU90_05625 [Gemmatimonas sp.]|nr:hypothetical protein [Gemmatimonas sp.]